MFELNIPNLYESQLERAYQPLNRFPSSTQDICLRLPASIDYGEADKFVWDNLDKLAKKDRYGYEMETLDIFQKSAEKQYHQITWRISLWHPEKTLTTNEVNTLLDGLSYKAKQALKAERI
jgi:phenylalanyl-tRNA synthetase beta subunit